MALAIPKPAALLAEKARAAIGSVLSPHRDPVSDTLTPHRLGRVMREADRGNVAAYLTLADEMEEREPHYASVLFTRKLGVSGSTPSVVVPTDYANTKIVEAVEALVFAPIFEGLILDLMDAVAKGFSNVEIMWDRNASLWTPREYLFREQRHFVFDADTLTEARLRTAARPHDGEPLDPFKWIQHRPKLRSGVPIRTGLARTIAVTYAAKRYTVADWLAFLDTFGMPIRIGRYPSHLSEQKKDLLKAVRAIGSDAAAVIPKEMDVEFVEAKGGSGGTTLFQQSAEYWDKQTSKVVLGQTMTSDDGSSLAQSKTHERVRFDIRGADGRSVAATINRDLIKPFVVLNFGEQLSYPTIKLHTEEPEDTKTLMESVRVFVNLGGKVQMTEVRDRLGLAEPEEGADLLLPESATNANSQPKQDDNDPAARRKRDLKPDNDDDEDAKAPSPRELNALRTWAQAVARAAERQLSEALGENQGTTDIVDEAELDATAGYRALLEPNVGNLLRRVHDAASFAEAREILEALEEDEGETLDVEALVDALARATFRMRGVGDATDNTNADGDQ